jgi:hypothetical protein
VLVEVAATVESIDAAGEAIGPAFPLIFRPHNCPGSWAARDPTNAEAAAGGGRPRRRPTDH